MRRLAERPGNEQAAAARAVGAVACAQQEALALTCSVGECMSVIDHYMHNQFITVISASESSDDSYAGSKAGGKTSAETCSVSTC